MKHVLFSAILLAAMSTGFSGVTFTASSAQTPSSQIAKQCENTRKNCQNNCERQFKASPEKKVSCTKDTCGVQYQACLNKAGSNTPAGTEQTTSDAKPRAPKAPAKDKMN